jgi:methyltransferase
MPTLYIIVGFLVVQRLAELGLSRRNHRKLLARGAVEVGQGHYPAMVALHAGWLLALPATIDPRTAVSLPLLAVFVLLECGRVWVIATLGPRWTTRVVVLPGAALIRSGPYRCVRHPNYAIVCAEMAVVPLMFGAWILAVTASVLNLLVLRTRLRVENTALERFSVDPDRTPATAMHRATNRERV